MGVINRGIRNAFRNSIRTFSIVVILGISIGLALAMLMARQAVQTKIDSVKSSIGNIVTISPAGSRGDEGGGEPLTMDQIASIKALPHIVTASETLTDQLTSTDTNLQSAIEAGSLGIRRIQRQQQQFDGQQSKHLPANFTPPVAALGSTDLNSLQSFGGGAVDLTSGQKFDPTVDNSVAVVGQDLATKNNLTVDSTFQAYGTTFTVQGIYDSGNRFSNNAVIMPLLTLQRLSGQTNDITNAIVQVDSITNLSSTTDAIKQKLGASADVVNQQDTSSQALTPLENIKSISLYSLLGTIIAGAAIILLTMLMIVRERRREIGVLKAIGATNLAVTAQFIIESLTLTVLGLLAGTAIGILTGNPITKLLVKSSTATTNQAGGPGAGGARFARFIGQGASSLQNIQASVGWHTLLYGIGVALLIAIIGSALPAIMISRVRPAEVMRSE